MKHRDFGLNIEGRVRKIRTQDFLVPLFEAISNSVHAIEEAGDIKSGKIEVKIIRDPKQTNLDENEIKPITGFVITDNGIGFHDLNMESFCQGDSTYKMSKGGKGVGRFTWLKFFSDVTIVSVFDNLGTIQKRSFSFVKSGVEDLKVQTTDGARGSIVTLKNIKSDFEPKTRKDHSHIIVSLIEHFISFLITGSMPELTVSDGSAKVSVVSFFRDSIGKTISQHTFEIDGCSFKAMSLRAYFGSKKNVVYLCGNKRASELVSLATASPFFAKQFLDKETLQNYSYQIFIESEYLDSIVNDDRDGFRFPDKNSLGQNISKEQIVEEALKIAQSELSEEISTQKEDNKKVIQNFVATDGPQYRYLAKHFQEEISKIQETDPKKIDLVLRRIQFEEELKTRTQVDELLKKIESKDENSLNDWNEKSKELMSKLSEAGKASLASYIVQRKYILDLLKKKLEIGQDDKFSREEAIHQLIFPMRTTSDDVGYEEQNLWIIDERLSYHYYLASDKPLSTIPPAEASSRKEPDLIVFNRPLALNDRPESERIESIVIVEFKRPGESSVNGDKNPVDQILEYIELIREGKAKTRKERPIQTSSSAYFFGYVVCEIDEALKKILKRKNMKTTPDERGMFYFFEEHRAYIEVIGYDKMLDDAIKRNRILFDKLQLPPNF